MDMTLSKRGDYVMRSAICLARAFGRGEGRKIREVVDETEVPRTFASQILADLVRAGLATSKAGRDGGYRLARAPEEVSVLEVVEAAEGPLRAERCALGAGPCRWDDVCPLHETWTAATAGLRDLLAATTLAELAARDAAIEAGTYAVPSDAHRSRPSAAPVADSVQAEVGAPAATAGLVRMGGRLGELAAAGLAETLERSDGGPAGAVTADGSLAAVAAGEEETAARFLVEWHATSPAGDHRLEGELSVRAVDDDRCELRLEGAWRQSGPSPVTAAALDRQARDVARAFLRRLARALDGSAAGEPPGRAGRRAPARDAGKGAAGRPPAPTSRQAARSAAPGPRAY